MRFIFRLIRIRIIDKINIIKNNILEYLTWLKKYEKKDRNILKKINKTNKKYWEENEINYYILPDGTKATGTRRKK